MRFLPTTVHAVIDYLWGALLIASPWLFGFADVALAKWAAVTFGVAGVLYSLCTRYELGVTGLISMKKHLWLDGIAGVALAASPWVLGVAWVVWAPHAAFGLFALAVALVTRTRPSRVAAAPHVGEAAAGETIVP